MSREAGTQKPNTSESSTPGAVHVQIYVAASCRICEYSHEVADVIQRHFPQVHLDMIDISAPEQTIPEIVFATPTYLLNGRIWSLGNPSLEKVHTDLLAALGEPS